MIKLKTATFIFIFTILLLPIFGVGAQTDVNTPNILLTPNMPSQFEEVTIRASFPLIDISRADIRWSINGSTQAEGVGMETFTFTTGGLGSISNIRVDITDRDNRSYFTTKTIRPTNIDIVWEAQTTIPPSYKGKALPSPESSVKVIALPTFITSNGVRLSPNELFYTWRINGATVRNIQTEGQQMITVQMPLLSNSMTVEVFVESPGGSLVGKHQTIIQSVDPEIVIYEENPLRGVIYENALPESFELNKSEITLFAENFYFSNEDDINYEWLVGNNIAIPDAQNNKRLTVVKDSSDSFGIETQINVKVININKIRQVIEKIFTLKF